MLKTENNTKHTYEDNSEVDYSYQYNFYMNLGVAGLSGFLYCGLPCSITGVSLVSFDEVISSYIQEYMECNNTHYMYRFFSALSINLGFGRLVSEVFSKENYILKIGIDVFTIVATMAGTYFADDYMDRRESIELGIRSFNAITDIYGTPWNENSYETIKLIGLQITEFTVDWIYVSKLKQFDLGTPHASYINFIGSDVSNFWQKGLELTFYNIVYKGSYIFIETLITQQEIEIERIVGIQAEKFVWNNPIIISNDKNNRYIVKEFHDNFEDITFGTCMVTEELLRVSYKQVYILPKIYDMGGNTNLFQAFIAVDWLLEIIQQLIIKPMQNYKSEVYLTYTQLDYKAEDIASVYKDSMEKVYIRGGIEFAMNEHLKLEQQKHELVSKFWLLKNGIEGISSFIIELRKFFTFVFFAEKDKFEKGIKTNLKSKIDDQEYSYLTEIMHAANVTYNININSKIANTHINKSLILNEKLIKIVKETKYYNAEKIYEEGSEHIKFLNYTLYHENTPLIKIDNLSIELGKIYIFKGCSGCGKTTIIKDIINVPLLYPISSYGTILLPEMSTKIMLDQTAFSSHSSNLLKSILFPIQISSIPVAELQYAKEKIIEFIHILDNKKFNGTSTLEKQLEDGDFKLSGGEQKKVGIMSIIINYQLSNRTCNKTNNIFLLDEPFAELDQDSIAAAQHLLKAYMGNCTMIITSHESVEDANVTFYDSVIKLTNGTLDISPLN